MAQMNRFLQTGSKGKMVSKNAEKSEKNFENSQIEKMPTDEAMTRISFVQISNVPKEKSELKNPDIPNGHTKPAESETPKKRHSPEKARQKRIARRVAKGKPVLKGLLRDPPKSLEDRLEQGVKLEWLSKTEFSLVGKEHKLDIKLVYIGSEEDRRRFL